MVEVYERRVLVVYADDALTFARQAWGASEDSTVYRVGIGNAVTEMNPHCRLDDGDVIEVYEPL